MKSFLSPETRRQLRGFLSFGGSNETPTTPVAPVVEPESAPSEPPFKVNKPGEAECTFVIADPELIQHLIYESVIHSQRQIAKGIKLQDLVLSVHSVDDFLLSCAGEESTAVQQFGQAVAQEWELVKERAQAARERGVSSFTDLPLTIMPEDKVAVTLSEGLLQGGVVQSARLGMSDNGPYVAVTYQFVVYNGEKFVNTTDTHYIGYFEGEHTFEELGVPSLKDELLAKLLERGQWYHQINGAHVQAQYSGNLSRSSWFGKRYFRADGRVMVDVRTFLKLDPNYDGFRGNLRRLSSADEVDMTDEVNLACTSPFVYGFSFASKMWGELVVEQVTPAAYRKDAFDRVVLSDARKRLIRALVSTDGDQTSFDDIVDGKGAGCIFLLAGPPGVGKTITAEAISETLERPLYMVGAGELGTEPGDVEKKLREVLDMATMWNAVLLIDECDIFLEKRTKDDIKRNALVAVFLRMLEYYSGILFLTTNRVDEIDEAFMSRISIALRYDKLNRDTRLAIWTGLAVGQGFGRIDFESLAEHDLNGREIKQCLKLAKALAAQEKREPCQEDIELIIEIGREFNHEDTGTKPV